MAKTYAFFPIHICFLPSHYVESIPRTPTRIYSGQLVLKTRRLSAYPHSKQIPIAYKGLRQESSLRLDRTTFSPEWEGQAGWLALAIAAQQHPLARYQVEQQQEIPGNLISSELTIPR